MLSVQKINPNKITYRSNKLYSEKNQNFCSNEARSAYYDMNKDVYVDYVDGDISLVKYLGGKLKNFWSILVEHRDPLTDLKAEIIEKSLINNSKRNLLKSNREYVQFDIAV